MPRSGIGLHPPALALSSEIHWVLARAFAPIAGPAGRPVPRSTPAKPEGTDLGVSVSFDASRAVATAVRCDLAARIAARHRQGQLDAELAKADIQALDRARVGAIGCGMRVIQQARVVAEIARELRVSLTLLKFAGLDAAGIPVLGWRNTADLDLLLPEGEAEPFAGALRDRGYSASGMPAEDHHLPALLAPEGVVVEVHARLPGVRIDGKRSATHRDLAGAGHLCPAPGYPAGITFLATAPQAAHLLVHALAQHVFWPAAYPLGRVLGDLIDLGLVGERPPFPIDQLEPWIRQDLQPEVVAAALALCRRLAAGDNPIAGASADPASLLARHWLAGALDESYREALRLGIFRRQPSDRSRFGQLMATFRRALFLSRAEVEAIYGRPRSNWGYLGRQIGRPFDLVGRLARYGTAWIGTRSATPSRPQALSPDAGVTRSRK